MNNPYQLRVQQKLSQCRLLIQRLNGAGRLERQEQEALLQAVVIHLAVACRSYIREIGSRLSVSREERLFTPADLVDAAPNGVGVEEIANQTWLMSILSAEREVLNPPPLEPVGQASQAAVQLIAIDSGTSKEELTLELVTGWLRALEGLAERQRQSFVEY